MTEFVASACAAALNQLRLIPYQASLVPISGRRSQEEYSDNDGYPLGEGKTTLDFTIALCQDDNSPGPWGVIWNRADGWRSFDGRKERGCTM